MTRPSPLNYLIMILVFYSFDIIYNELFSVIYSPLIHLLQTLKVNVTDFISVPGGKHMCHSYLCI